jgi:hypothetical protein
MEQNPTGVNPYPRAELTEYMEDNFSSLLIDITKPKGTKSWLYFFYSKINMPSYLYNTVIISKPLHSQILYQQF